MASRKSRLQKIRDQMEKIEESFEAQEDDSVPLTKRLDGRISGVVSAALVLVALYFALLWLPGRSVAGIVSANPVLAGGAVTVGLLLMLMSGDFNVSFSFPFALITIAATSVVWAFMPASVQAMVPIEAMLGVDLPAFSGLQFFALSLAAAGAFWAIQARLTGSAKKPETIVDTVTKRYAKLAETYSRIAVLFGILGLFIVYAVMANGAELVGQAGGVLSLEPYLSSNIFTAVLGFAALGGELPIIGSLPVLRGLSPMGWLTVSIGVILLAASAAYSASGRTSRLFR